MTIDIENHSDGKTAHRLVDGVHDAAAAARTKAEAARTRVMSAVKRVDARMTRHPLAFAVGGLAVGYILARVFSRR